MTEYVVVYRVRSGEDCPDFYFADFNEISDNISRAKRFGIIALAESIAMSRPVIDHLHVPAQVMEVPDGPNERTADAAHCRIAELERRVNATDAALKAANDRADAADARLSEAERCIMAIADAANGHQCCDTPCECR